MYSEPKLIRNAIRTPDGTLLVSRHRHDFVSHVDATNGHKYQIDGGLEYCRRSVPGSYEEACVWSDDPHEVIREAMEWGSRGKDGKQPVRYIRLMDMSDEHIRNCLDTQRLMNPSYRVAMERELVWRKRNGITITDN